MKITIRWFIFVNLQNYTSREVEKPPEYTYTYLYTVDDVAAVSVRLTRAIERRPCCARYGDSARGRGPRV